jgi:hypothetical protein
LINSLSTQSRYISKSVLFDEDEEINDYEQKPDQVFLPLPFMAVQDIEKELAFNALTIVTEIGKPTLFITGTVNVNWPEIQSVQCDGGMNQTLQVSVQGAKASGKLSILYLLF